MSKTMNIQIPGLIRHCSPVKLGHRTGIARRDGRDFTLIERLPGGVMMAVSRPDRKLWTLDLRDITGAFHAAKFIDDHFAELKPHGVEIGHDFDTVLGDGTADPMARGIYYVAYSHASDGKPLTADERKALTRIVLWVAERVG